MCNKKSPKIEGLGPPMCWTNFSRQTLMRIFWCVCNYNDFTMHINLKCCSICYHSIEICRGRLGIPNLGGLRELGGRELRQSKAHPQLPYTSQYKVLLYPRSFGWNSNVKLCPPPIRPPIWGLGLTLGVENGTNRNFDPTFLFDFYTHNRRILHRLATTWQTTDRQCDRDGPPML